MRLHGIDSIPSVLCRRAIDTLGASMVFMLCLIAGAAAPGTRFLVATSRPIAASDYTSALAIANRFLQAWQEHDEETGILLLSEHARHRTSESAIATFFSEAAQPAYEISRGAKGRRGRYVFPLRFMIWHKNASPENALAGYT